MILTIAAWFVFMLPSQLFIKPYSLVLLDHKGRLLQARIAEDGQWRFPPQTEIPQKFERCLIAYEDKRFFYHPGIDVLSLARAMKQNLRAGKVVSGGSTLTMQVARLARNKSRSIWNKLYEMLYALRLECRFSKNELLALYAAHAPFGGNVIGLEAASWRYYGRSAAQLSWGEAAALAVLPNSPGMVHPARNREWLLRKRNALLDKLLHEKIIDESTERLARLEPLPDKPVALPQYAPHLIDFVHQQLKQKKKANEVVQTTINLELQEKVSRVLNLHQRILGANEIHNGAILVLDVETGGTLAYVGNTRPSKVMHQNHVDVIQAARSPGSTLKPILYEAMLHEGFLLPGTLVADIPTQIAGYSPRNFDLEYDGAIPANKALARSLNVPAIRMLNLYKYERFYHYLKKLGITTLNQPAEHYGLSLILGGGENTLWELAGVYASFARVLNHYSGYNGHYNPDDIHAPSYTKAEKGNRKSDNWMNWPTETFYSAAAIFHTFEAMNELMRPGEELLWQQFAFSQRIAWKTGTSFGFRDGWAIGVTPKYVVAVWIGNADGEGRPGLIGVETAAPVLFDVFKLLPSSAWFEKPYDELRPVMICLKSGYKASEFCSPIDTQYIQQSGLRTQQCPYHQLVHLDPGGRYRVNSDCESPSNMKHESWFVLPPAMEYYYRSSNSSYKPLPPFRADCMIELHLAMEMIYPKRSNKIFVPIELDGNTGKAVFEVAHREPDTRIFWTLDDEFIGSTTRFHQMALSPKPGRHFLVLTDETGNRIEQRFEIIAR